MIDPAPSDGTISDEDRRRLEVALAAALLLLYTGRRDQALAQLGAAADTAGLTPAEHDQILAFAQDRARLIQEGVNERMDGSDDPQATAADIDQYNQTTLQPYMIAWATQQAISNAYGAVPMGDGTAKEYNEDGSDRLWEWVQNTDFEDDCTEAMDASPASYEELTGIGGGDPPVHENCQCTLTPQE